MEKLLMFVAAAVGIVTALLAGLLVFFRFHRTGSSSKSSRIGRALVAGGMVMVFLVLAVVNVLAVGILPHVMDALMTYVEGTPVDSEREDWISLCNEIAEQGMVLLRNENGTLPLDITENRKINLLGYRAYDPIYSGSGSGSTSATGATDILTALETAGFVVNPAVIEECVYEVAEAEAKGIGFMGAEFHIDEKPLSAFVGSASFENMREFSNTAIVVIGRTGGEGSDLTRFESEDGRHYLELSKVEEDLLRKARETFETLIVVYNGANAMEMGYLETYCVDACVWAGIPGPNGFSTLGKILNGAVNPSGRLPDTWVYDVFSNPVSENFGEFHASNADAYYVEYAEGIYVGYKWYETAYAERAVVTNTVTGEQYDYSQYDAIVQYPFGYGLSYTAFSQEIVGGIHEGESLNAMGKISVEVKVTNIGNVSGRETVELYITVPYTAYDIVHGVEKSAVSLAAYGKTAELAPGESQTMTLVVDMEEIASYDASYDNQDGTFGTYMLDEGEYKFSIRENAHVEIMSVTAKMEAPFYFSGNNKRTGDMQAAYNQFSAAERGPYLSRNNGFENYETVMRSVSSEILDCSFDKDNNAYNPLLDEFVSKEYLEGIDYGVKGNITLAEMAGVDYNDSKWETFISQLSIDEMKALSVGAVFGIAEVESIEKPSTMDSDGPLGITNMYVSEVNSVAYPCMPLLAATFHNELARLYGNYMADQAHEMGVTGWYAPAMNIHRSAFGGRNFEYYSEDAVLSAGIAFSETLGAREKGLLVYLKHFALNEQETRRSAMLHTYANEQAIREIYLKPFEEAVKKGGATGVMTAMNYIGDVYSSASEPLCTQVLRNEWGFHGMVITDMPENRYIISCVDAAIRAGTDSWLGLIQMRIDTSDKADIYYLQRLSKNVLYAHANAVVIETQVGNWRGYLLILDLELAILLALGFVYLTAHSKRSRTTKRNRP